MRENVMKTTDAGLYKAFFAPTFCLRKAVKPCFSSPVAFLLENTTKISTTQQWINILLLADENFNITETKCQIWPDDVIINPECTAYIKQRLALFVLLEWFLKMIKTYGLTLSWVKKCECFTTLSKNNWRCSLSCGLVCYQTSGAF